MLLHLSPIIRRSIIAILLQDVTWFVDTQQAGPSVGPHSIGAVNQGASVSLSADGNTLAVRGFTNNSGNGAT